ncbi:MAG TPA: hypothetical protein VEI07_14950 [Planctomycetaceae bacterium]|nr:hypothetical protein [Planctomycetaceae bacterium]
MDQIARNVRDLGKEERRVYEAALGETLREDQQVILRVVTPTQSKVPAVDNCKSLPDWCNVYDGLSDAEVVEIESAILDRNGWKRDELDNK